MKIISKIELLLIGMWLGAACFFSLGVAPSAFSVLPTGELAGNIVNRTLMIVNISGFLIGLFTLATSFIPGRYRRPLWAWARRGLIIIMTAACGIGHFVISFWLAYLRLQIGKPVGELAATDPLKVWFDQLHQTSVWVLITAMVAALFAFLVMSGTGTYKADDKPKTDSEFDFPPELIK